MIDLHLHSTASDGLHAPAEVVRLAALAGLDRIALTDHDTLGGYPEAAAEGQRLGVEVLPGVEISIEHGPGTYHMIGLLVDPDEPALREALERVRGGRRQRNLRLVERLGELGVPVRHEEVTRLAVGGVVGRPHFARVMVDQGYVSGHKQAFDRYLGKEAPAYVPRLRLGAAQAVSLIHGAGGVAVLCHPFTLGFGRPVRREALLEFVRTQASLGLDAIEVWCSESAPAQERLFLEIAEALGLLVSGGSDFHGFGPRDERLGIAGRKLDIPGEVLRDLELRASTYRKT